MGAKLEKLRNYKVAMVCDDSGSMNTPVDGGFKTRWDELKEILKFTLQILPMFERNGLDIYFLNKGSFHGVQTYRDIEPVLDAGPSGYTPLMPVLRQIVEENPAARFGHDKKLLIFVISDGAPTDDSGNNTIAQLDTFLRSTMDQRTTYINFLLCTDDDEFIRIMRTFDREVSNVDVTDDYNTEKQLIVQRNPQMFSFSFGDYIVKALVGSIDREIDALDG